MTSPLSLSGRSLGMLVAPRTEGLPEPLTVQLEQGPVVLPHGQMLRNAADLEELHDLVFQLGKKEAVMAHYFVLAVRFPCLLDESVFKPARSRASATVLAAPKDFPLSAAAFRELLLWVYTGALDPGLSPPLLRELATGLDALGGPFIPVPLQFELELVLRARLAAAPRLPELLLLFQAPGGGAACERLRHLLQAHVFRNWTGFLEDREGGRQLGIELVQALSRAQQAADPGTVAALLQPPAARPAGAAQILEQFRTAFVARVHTDAVLVSAEGEALECHRALLAAACPRWRPAARASPRKTEPPPGSPRRGTAGELSSPRAGAGAGARPKTLLELPGGGRALPSTALRAMLQFLYSGVVTFTCQVRLSLCFILSSSSSLLSSSGQSGASAAAGAGAGACAGLRALALARVAGHGGGGAGPHLHARHCGASGHFWAAQDGPPVCRGALSGPGPRAAAGRRPQGPLRPPLCPPAPHAGQ